MIELLPQAGVAGGILTLISAYAIYRKLKPQMGQITVISAEKALIVQTGVLENMQKELNRMASRLEAVEAELASAERRIEELESDKARLRIEARSLKSENTKLRNRVKALEENGG